VDRLGWRGSDGADRESLGCRFGEAVKALSVVLKGMGLNLRARTRHGHAYFDDGLHLTKVSGGATFDEWHVGCHAHLVDVSEHNR
jgi:hypothetical protein